MLNYMEYWVRDALSDQFTQVFHFHRLSHHFNSKYYMEVDFKRLQEDMKHFRQKLAVILLDSDLNRIKGNPTYYQSDDEKSLHSSDCDLLDDPPNGVEDKRPTAIPAMPVDQHELIIGLCNYITSIDDAKCLE